MGIGWLGVPAVGLAWDFLPPLEPEKDLPPGLRQHVVTLLFRPVGRFQSGDRFPISLRYVNFASFLQTPLADFETTGEIRFGDGGPPAVEELAAHVHDFAAGGSGSESARDVHISWSTESTYDSMIIERNGEEIARLSGDSTLHVDASLSSGVYIYKVVGVVGDDKSFPATVVAATVDSNGIFKRGDSNRDDAVNLSDVVTTLEFLFGGGTPLPCDDAADADDNGGIALTDAVLTLNHLYRGLASLPSPGTQIAWFDPTADQLGCAR
jgi:hypothetical protein